MTFKNLQFNFEKIRPWLTLLAIAWLLASLGLGWLVNSLVIILGLLFLLPVIAFFGFRWWLQKNLVTNQCPVCGYELTGINNSQVQCANCGEQLLVKNFQFQRFTPEGTIDVKAVEVQAQSLED
jgi:DNA-directed RNA polymerase subunit RPC12/RpoP